MSPDNDLNVNCQRNLRRFLTHTAIVLALSLLVGCQRLPVHPVQTVVRLSHDAFHLLSLAKQASTAQGLLQLLETLRREQ